MILPTSTRSSSTQLAWPLAVVIGFETSPDEFRAAGRGTFSTKTPGFRH